MDMIKKEKIDQFCKFSSFCNLLVVCIFLGLILALNFHTDYTSDDFRYHFFYDTIGNPLETTHRMKVWEVFSSMVNHWKMWNGRIVSHGVLQLVLMLGKGGFRIFNSIMFVLLGILICEHAAWGSRKSPLLLFSIYVGIWFFVPQFGMTILWASGAANYLWNGVLILGFTLPYRIYLSNCDKWQNNGRNIIIMGIGGVFAGCTNENSGGAMVLLCMMYLILYLYKKIPVPKWAWAGIAGGIMGCILLIAAPGNYRISSKTDFLGLLERGKSILLITKKELTLLFVIIFFLAVLVMELKPKGKKEKEFWVPWFIYMIAGTASILALTLSAMWPERAWFIGTVFFLVTAAYLFQQLLAFLQVSRTIMALTVVILFVCSFLTEYQKVKETYIQVKEGIDIIEQALDRGERVAVIPMVKPSDSKYDAYNGTGYVKEAADDWLNDWMAHYYGIERIYGTNN